MNELEQLHAEMRACRLCLEAGYQIVPGAVMQGQASARVLLIGQAPGVTEVEAKRPFNAGSGRKLFSWLGEVGWEEASFRATHYMTSVTKCYPGKPENGRGDRVPTPAEQALCRGYLEREIALVNPVLIILVGKLSSQLLFPARLKLTETIGKGAYFAPAALARPVNFKLKQATLHERYVEYGYRTGRWVIPLPHPSGASVWPNLPQNKPYLEQALTLLRDIKESWEL
ncbi:MAG: hypothetical protein KDE59_02755 [Anaerolineales bacterium]|nr:hypothetical protein [Anaerolineales bacterium]